MKRRNLILLAMTCIALTTPVVSYAAALVVYDDFNGPVLDPAKWVAQRESLRVIQDGKLVLAHRSGANSDNNLNTQLRHVSPPTNLTSLQADVTLADTTVPVAGGYNRMRLRGAFYNDGTTGTGALGDIIANAGLRVGVTGTPEAWWNAFRCADADCTTTTDSIGSALGPVTFNTPYTVRIAWNGTAFTVTATPVDGGTPVTQTVTPPLASAGPPRTGNLALRAEVSAWTSSPGVLAGYTKGTFGNVYINGNLFDDFSSGTINPAKWRDFEWGRTLQGGALVLTAQAPATKNQYASIRVANPNAITELAADVTLTARTVTTPSDGAQAGLIGTFYNTGTGTVSGDVTAQVNYWANGDGTITLGFNVFLPGLTGLNFGEQFATGLALGESHRLRLGWDGAVFTYGVDSLLHTFDPRSQAPVARAPVNPRREVYANAVSGAAGVRAAITASVDALYVNPEALTALPTLRPFQTVRLAGDVASAGVGLRGTGTGTITLATLPANAVVQDAFLYWATLGRDGTFTSPTLNGSPVQGTLIGQGDDPNAGTWQSYAYRADVTSLVSGNGNYVIAGLPAAGPTNNDTEGASLVVLYTVPNAPIRQVAISDGLATLNYSNTLPVRLLVADAPFAGLAAVDPTGAKLTLLVGDGQVSDAVNRDFAGLNATLLTPSADAFTGAAGPTWDNLTLDASSALTAGATAARAVLSTWGDGLVWVAAILSVPGRLHADAVGVFRPNDGTFYLDANANGAWDGCGTDRCLAIGMNGDIPLVGDWNGAGTSKVGLFRPSDGTFYLDYNGNGVWDGCGVDRCLSIGMNGDIPLVGDWNGTGTSKVGAFRPSDGTFYLDYNGSGTWDGCGTDRCLQIGMLGDIPLVGDWNGNGTSKVGAFRPSDGTFYLDYNGSGTWEGCGTDRCLHIGMNGDIPLVGDWNGSGTSKVGAFRPSDGTFYLDYNGSGTWEGCGTDKCLTIGLATDRPLVGDWDGTGTSKVGVFRPSDGTFYLDYNGSGTWEGCGTDRCLQIGLSGDTPLVGKW